ncbi:MAG TPA: peptidylprolyl isomerase [Ignavibacteriaceae bacterium]|nr:peptidylprolyl isomerase [Ignavibacteriaceae bacterium]
MSLRVSSLLLAFLTILVISCSPEHSKIVIAEYNDSQVTMGEFEKAYAKNSGSYEAASKDSFQNYKNFADLYVNFKMKLKDAEKRGYQNDSALSQELLDYKKKVGASYILEKYLVEPNIKDWYEKRKIEIRASHLMIRPENNDVEAARKLANALLDSIKKGAKYEDMVLKYSQDQYSKNKGGDIYYFTAGQLPYEFEDAAYKTEVGQIYPEVVQTKFGFHIIKVTDKKPRVPKIRASHILASYTNNPMAIKDTMAAKVKMDSILTALKSGEDFAEVAKRYSDDPGSKENGGDLGFFERRMMVPEFDEAAFKLDVGQVSDVVKTGFGLHVIKVTEKQSYPTFEEDRENLKNLLKRSRYNDLYSQLTDSLGKQYNYKLDENVIQQIFGYNDSTFIGAELKGLDDFGNKTIFSFANVKESVNDFYSKMKGDTEFAGKRLTTDILKKAAKKFSEQMFLEEKALSLDKTDPQFADLMHDYQNGIFIFKLQEDEVWNKVKIDSAKLFDYYQNNKDKFMWKDRVGYTEIFAKKDSLINDYYKQLKAGANFDSLAAKTERAGYKEKNGKYDLQVVGSTEFSKAVNNLSRVGDFTEPIQNSGGYSILRLDVKDPSRVKTFEEAKPEVSGAVQEVESKRLENEYLDSLKKIYKPVIYYDKLHEAFKVETK